MTTGGITQRNVVKEQQLLSGDSLGTMTCHFLNCLQGDGQLDAAYSPPAKQVPLAPSFLHLSTTDGGAN